MAVGRLSLGRKAHPPQALEKYFQVGPEGLLSATQPAPALRAAENYQVSPLLLGRERQVNPPRGKISVIFAADLIPDNTVDTERRLNPVGQGVTRPNASLVHIAQTIVAIIFAGTESHV